MKPNKYQLDVTLAEIAYWYMKKNRIELTTGNLFTIMEKILKKVDMKNKNTKDKVIAFVGWGCVVKE